MSRKRDGFDRIKNNPKNVSYKDLDHLLQETGFVLRKPKSGTSHRVYKIEGCPELLTVPIAKPVNEIYVKKALKLIQIYGNLDED
jgi:predicted RNA binding protein YcfA (HicA-like mRNA interferase family)